MSTPLCTPRGWMLGIVSLTVLASTGCDGPLVPSPHDVVDPSGLTASLTHVEEGFSYDFPSTNELNRNKEVPGREGQDAPHVNEVEVGIGEVTLEFVNNTNSLAFFEFRIDGQVREEGTGHPVVVGDVIYPGVTVDGRGIDDPVVDLRTFQASEKVEIRLALGGERDWDFDWTPFYVASDAASKEACRDGGWEEFGFRNQGLCIRFVETGKDSR